MPRRSDVVAVVISVGFLLHAAMSAGPRDQDNADSLGRLVRGECQMYVYHGHGQWQKVAQMNLGALPVEN